jgi:hypothetical protein
MNRPAVAVAFLALLCLGAGYLGAYGRMNSHSPTDAANWALVFVGIVTFIFIGWQAWETRKSADASRVSAESAKQNIDIYKSKERARLIVELSPFCIDPGLGHRPVVDLTVSIHGSSPAFILEHACVTYETPEDWIDEPELGCAVMFPIPRLPKAINPDSKPIRSSFFVSFDHRDLVIPEIELGRLFLGVRGFIRYKDVFEKEHLTAFRYVWKYMTIDGALQNWGAWKPCGAPEENVQT